MRFLFNPFINNLDIVDVGGANPNVESLTGNDSVLVPADGSGNINVVGENATGINTTGNAGTHTLTVHGIASTSAQIGTTRYSTNAEAAAQTLTTAALTPSNITSMFSVTPLPATQGGSGRISPSAHQLMVTNGASPFTLLGVATNGQIPIGSTGVDPVLATITAGSGILITNGAGSITISSPGGGTSWVDVTGTTQNVSTATGYISDNAGTVTFILPASATFGDYFRIVGLQGGWTLTQNAGQQVKFGSAATTLGVGGSLASANAGDCIELVATNTSVNTIWRVISSIGNITVV